MITPRRSLAFLALVLLVQPASGFWSMEDLQVMVMRSTLIVRAKVIAIGELKQDDPDGPTVEFATLAVEKVLSGTCDRVIRLIDDVADSYGERSKAGHVYYLCLTPSTAHPGYYEEINAGLSKMRLKKNGRVHLTKLIIPAPLKKVLTNPAQKTLEDMLRWLRGPTISARPMKPVFECDEVIAFVVTVTNDSPRPMRLGLDTDERALSRLIQATPHDGEGFPILQELDSCFVPPPLAGADGKPKRVIRTLAPGERIEGTVRYQVLLGDCVQDPARTRGVSLQIRRYDWLEEWPPPDAWLASARVDVPVRLSCPYRGWTATLPQPAGPWRIAIYRRHGMGNTPVYAHAGMPVPIGITCIAPTSRFATWGYSMHGIVTPKAERQLASCFEVARNGKAVAGPQATREEVQTWLKSVLDPYDTHGHTFDLAKHFPMRRPGTYRVRLALPFAEGESISNVLTIHVVDAPVR